MTFSSSQFDSRMDTLDEEERATIIAAALSAYQKGLGAGYKKLDKPVDRDYVFNQWEAYGAVYLADMQSRGGSEINGEFIPWFATYTQNFRESLWSDLDRATLSNTQKDILDKYQTNRENHAKIVALNEVIRLERQAELTVMRGVGGVEWFFLKGGNKPCPFCAGYINMAYRWDMLPYYPPSHRNCVCCLIPILRDNPILDTPAALNGTLDIDIEFDYDEFYEDI